MMLLTVLTLTFLFLILLNLPALTITGNFCSDKEALLFFFNGLPRTGKLDWNRTDKVDEDDVCEWLGISCTRGRVTSINLTGAELFGPIVANSIGKLDALVTLDLRSNLLYGNIPPDILSIDTLQNISIQNNSLCGNITRSRDFPLPRPLPRPRPHIGIVDLSFNSFTGSIPPVLSMLARMTNLSWNLSYNSLEGPIPESLQNWPVDSFIGNPKLCGKPLPAVCPPPAPPPAPAPESIAPFSEKVGFVAFVASLMILFLLLV